MLSNSEPLKRRAALSAFFVSPSSVSRERAILRATVKFKAEMSALIDMKDYPFDSHVLPIVLEDKGGPEDVKYEVDEAGSSLAPSIRLPGWALGEGALNVLQQDAGDGRKLSQFVFAIEAKRPALMATAPPPRRQCRRR